MNKGNSPNTPCCRCFIDVSVLNPDLSGVYLVKPHLALAEGALGAVFNPGGAAEAGDAVLVRARLGDVVADGVGLAGVGDAAGTALALGHHGELTVHGRARQGPAVHLPLLPSRRDGPVQTGRREGQKQKRFRIIPGNGLLRSPGRGRLFTQTHGFLETRVCVLEAASALNGKNT